jgi:DNA polymerase I-like protein with 3'-5' exonuclease and polymerase domains
MNTLEVTSAEEAARLCNWLLDYPQPVGTDTETLGWSPDDKVSPVGRARVWCLTLCWGEKSKRTTVFVPREYVTLLKPWLESDTLQKVGTNLLGFDCHALRNSGIELSGVLADTGVMSRLLDSRPGLDDGEGHGLKAWAKRLGHEQVEFETLVIVTRTRTVPGKVAEYKKTGYIQGVLKGGERQDVVFKQETVELGLDEVWRDFPERREAIKRYACVDPMLSLELYEALRKQLESRRW